MHPRGRFNVEFRKSSVTVTGKAATLKIAWDNVRHIIRYGRWIVASGDRMGIMDTVNDL